MPLELLGLLNSHAVAGGFIPASIAYYIKSTFLWLTRDPIDLMTSPQLLPTRAHDDIKNGEQLDIVLIPGGNFSLLRIHFLCIRFIDG